MDNLQSCDARLVVHGLPEFKKPQVARLAKWLRAQADQLEKSPEKYSKRYIARLLSK